MPHFFFHFLFRPFQVLLLHEKELDMLFRFSHKWLPSALIIVHPFFLTKR